ncbi:Hypp6782 [Branchiostoma lanceolatum]|uniref:Hypp6782 protein n=1 Tax=Branchiostoma lanceolatum TaxID=7740 RepID=A0A8K0E562_BRALA|nr:Hypp6782 [Branchiostoma lanceolatum]
MVIRHRSRTGSHRTGELHAPNTCPQGECKGRQSTARDGRELHASNRPVSTRPDMDLYILDSGALGLARFYRYDMLALRGDQEPGTDHREFRHAAYRLFVLWQYRLGRETGW